MITTPLTLWPHKNIFLTQQNKLLRVILHYPFFINKTSDLLNGQKVRTAVIFLACSIIFSEILIICQVPGR